LKIKLPDAFINITSYLLTNDNHIVVSFCPILRKMLQCRHLYNISSAVGTITVSVREDIW